jgi:LacI family transcriptional regulator
MSQVTIKDIAKICGVGVSTVSRAINDHPAINDETKARVNAVIKEYNYIPNNSARNLKRIESNTIAVLAKGINNTFVSEMIRSGQKYVAQKKYNLYIHQVEDTADEIDTAIELMKEKRLKGIVFLGGYFDHAQEKLKQLSVPFILSSMRMNDAWADEVSSSVYVDDEQESYKMVDYLCRIGHRRIAILTASEDDRSIGKLRYNGYIKALKAHGIEPDPKLICKMKPKQSDYSMENGYILTKRLLESGEEFTALYAASDYMAIGACKAMYDMGKRVPQDYSVAGYDGLRITEFYCPSITTIRQPIKEMTEKTLEVLFREIEEGSGHQRIVFDGELIIGGSTRAINEI